MKSAGAMFDEKRVLNNNIFHNLNKRQHPKQLINPVHGDRRDDGDDLHIGLAHGEGKTAWNSSNNNSNSINNSCIVALFTRRFWFLT